MFISPLSDLLSQPADFKIKNLYYSNRVPVSGHIGCINTPDTKDIREVKSSCSVQYPPYLSEMSELVKCSSERRTKSRVEPLTGSNYTVLVLWCECEGAHSIRTFPAHNDALTSLSLTGSVIECPAPTTHSASVCASVH